MLSAGGQCGRCGISLNHHCDPEEQWKHDPWNDAHSSLPPRQREGRPLLLLRHFPRISYYCWTTPAA